MAVIGEYRIIHFRLNGAERVFVCKMQKGDDAVPVYEILLGGNVNDVR